MKPRLSAARVAVGASDPSKAYKGSRPAYFEGAFVETRIYERDRLEPGALIDGPAIVESALTTVVLPPGHKAEIDPFRDLVLRSA